MAGRRQSGIWSAPDGMSSHPVASARLLQRNAALTSVAGGWRVFIIGSALKTAGAAGVESGRPPTRSLKLLEEPPQRALFVLTTAEPGLILPTIRSRATPIRLGRLTDDEVRAFLTTVKPDLATDNVVASARGSIGSALGTAGEAVRKARSAADEFLRTVAEVAGAGG